MKYTINMVSSADTVKGQGVGSAYEEQVKLVKEGLNDRFDVYENRRMLANITHYHTVNFGYFLTIPFTKHAGTTVGYVHFLPETMESSLKLPFLIKKIFYGYLIRFYKRMDFLVTVNPYFIERLAAYGVDPAKVTYIPNFVCDSTFYPLPEEEKKSLRMKYGLPTERFTVVCAGQLQRRKGIFDFIELAKKMPDTQFVWAGGFSFGKITDGYEEVRKVVENPPDNIKFTGIVDRDKMNEIYNLADVMFLPSYEELFPMTILEAMNCRVPLLLRDIPIYENILFDYYLRAKDNDGFAEILNRLQNDSEYYNNAVEQSWKGHCFYNKEHVLSMWDDFYTELVREKQLVKSKSKTKSKIKANSEI